jgi:outer membrane biosynthesis protein TonB
MPSFKNKNIKAASYTILVLTVLCLLFFFVSWAPPVHDAPEQTEDIEVELGDAPEGSSEGSQGASASQPPILEENISSAPAEKEIATSDVDKEAPAIAKKQTKQVGVVSKKPAVEFKKTAAAVEATPAPPPAPKYVYKGVGTNKEVEDPDRSVWRQGTGQGQGAGDRGQGSGQGQGTGDKGDGIGSGGLSIVRGLQGRKISRFPSFTDEFNENAKVAVDVRVDPNGNVIGANIQPRGTTTANSSIKNIALQKAKLLKFSTNADAADEEVGTVVFVFRVRD